MYAAHEFDTAGLEVGRGTAAERFAGRDGEPEPPAVSDGRAAPRPGTDRAGRT